jgi:hypothetical protein
MSKAFSRRILLFKVLVGLKTGFENAGVVVTREGKRQECWIMMNHFRSDVHSDHSVERLDCDDTSTVFLKYFSLSLA